MSNIANNLETTRDMKESGIEWIGMIPKDWGIRKVKDIFKIGRGRVISKLELVNDGIYPVFSSQTLNNGCLGYINTYDFDCKQLTWTTDGANAGEVFYREGKHNCTNVCGTLQLKNKLNSLKFHGYYLRFATQYYKRPDINGAKIMNNEMANILLLIPPLSEQQAIANYLDEQVGKIDELIAEQKTAIENWKSYKQSLITETVTKGLNPNVEMKDSGIEWIGKIPKEWEVNKIKRMCYLKGRIGWQGLKASEFIEDGPYLVTGTDFKNGRVEWESCYHISNERFVEAPEIHLKKDDLLITKDGTIGKLAYIDFLPGPTSLNSHLLLIRPTNNQCLNKFLFWMFSSSIFKFYTGLAQGGSIMESLSQKKIGEFSIPLPQLQEQQAIADFLDEKCSKIDQTIEQKQTLIKQLEEYKQSLIYECVTGKRCVL